jgi:hypothetical protein
MAAVPGSFKIGSWLKRFLKPPLIVFAACLMWCEEWLWVHLKRLTAWLARLAVIRWYEAFIRALPPYPTMVVFLLPGLLLIPVKLLAVYWIASGYWLFGGVLIFGAKVLGTAIAARSYVVCQPKLMTIGWFKRLHDWLFATRDFLYAALHAMPVYQFVHIRIELLKQSVRRWMSVIRRRNRRGLWSRWQAIRRWHRIRKSQS